MEILNYENALYNVFISANAGSGKTKILVDRFIALLIQGVQIEKILCITYTINSTEDIYNKITTRLMAMLQNIRSGNEKYVNYPKNLEDILSNALLNIHKTKIQTFHSFCSDIIKDKLDHFPGISDNFNILDSEKQTVYLKYLQEKISHKLEDFTNLSYDIKKSCNILLKEYGRYNFMELIAKIISNIQYFIPIIEKKNQYFEILQEFMQIKDNDANVYLELSNNEFISILQHLIAQTKSGARIDQYLQNIKLWLDMNIENKIKNINLLINSLFTSASSLRSEFKKTIENTIMFDDFSKILSNIHTKHSFFLTKHTINLAEYIANTYKNLKSDTNYLDYSDLIYLVYSKLSSQDNNEFLMQLYSKFDHILLDEAQDMTDVQWEIIDYIFTEYTQNYCHINKTIFIVGDAKQSIYGFNGSNVDSFIVRMNQYPEICEKNNILFCKKELLESYRSKAEVLEYVDKFCNNLEDKIAINIGEIKHIPTRGFGGKVPEIKLEKEENSMSVLFDTINNIINSGYNFSDISVLVPRRSGYFYNEFIYQGKLRNIPIDSDKMSDNIFAYCFFDIINLIGLQTGLIADYDKEALLKSPIMLELTDNISRIFHAKYTTILEFFGDIMSDKSEIYINLINNYGHLVHIAIEKILTQVGCDATLAFTYLSLRFTEILETNTNNNGISLMTIHGAKGLENKITFVLLSDDRRYSDGYFLFTKPDFKIFISLSRTFATFGKYLEKTHYSNFIYGKYGIKGKNADFEMREKNRLLYVAFTRAKDVLCVIEML